MIITMEKADFKMFQFSVSFFAQVWQEVCEKRLLSLGRTLGEASLDMQSTLLDKNSRSTG